jgi:NADPH-ferrihemoprotein reductase
MQIYPGGRISIYFATQTGTAESFAQQLEREGSDHGFLVRVVDMEDTVRMEDMMTWTAYGGTGGDGSGTGEPHKDNEVAAKERICRAIILASTYGEGEPTDNSAAFVAEVKQALLLEQEQQSSSPLKGLDYTVFGLGNREYELFNAMGKFFDSSLEQLGGSRIYELGLGDDNDDLEADFEKWKDGLWKALQQRYIGDNTSIHNRIMANKRSSQALPECEYDIQWHASETTKLTGTATMDKPLDQVHGSSRHYFTAVDCPVSQIRELQTPIPSSTSTTSPSLAEGSTVHVELDLSKLSPKQRQQLSYETADNLGVLPCNSPQVVETVAKALGYDLDAVFTLQPPQPATDSNSGKERREWHGEPFPMPITVRECLTRYLDLTSAPRRSDLKLLSLYAKDPIDKRALQTMSSKEGKAQYKEKIVDDYRGMVDLVTLCPSLEIPLPHLIQLCHFQLPRFYTIASCPKVFPDSIHLTVAVTKEQRKDGTWFEGVCSTHIAKQQQQQSPNILRVFVRPSTFRLPNDPSKPIIMIGPGTGIAPMRALLQERRHQQLVEKRHGVVVGSNILYFGCKRKEIDYLYQDELNRYQEEGVLTELHLAFSRQDPLRKVYVQHLLKQQAASTWKRLDGDGAYIYVCGGVKMGHDVTETLKEIVSTQGEMSFEEASIYLSQLSGQGRYIQELWS